MELKSKVQTEDVGTRCRIRVHIHARTKSVEGKTVHFRVITAVVGRMKAFFTLANTDMFFIPILEIRLLGKT